MVPPSSPGESGEEGSPSLPFVLPTTLFLIRHGATAAGTDRLWGQTDSSLSAAGRRQAAQAAAGLAGIPVAAIYASDLSRAMDTAVPLGKVLGLTAQPLPQLRERHFGAWEGMALAQMSREDPEALNALWREAAFAPPDGESVAALQRRVVDAVREICSRHPGQTVAVVAHAGPFRGLLGHGLGLDVPAMMRLGFAYGCAALVQVFGDGGWVVGGVNLPPSAWGESWSTLTAGSVGAQREFR